MTYVYLYNYVAFLSYVNLSPKGSRIGHISYIALYMPCIYNVPSTYIATHSVAIFDLSLCLCATLNVSLFVCVPDLDMRYVFNSLWFFVIVIV